jgi:hypothetical protein
VYEDKHSVGGEGAGEVLDAAEDVEVEDDADEMLRVTRSE